MTSAYSIREDAQANTFSATELEVATALKALQPSVQSHHAQTFVAQLDCYPISTQNALGRENGIDDWPLGLYKDGDPSPTLTKAHGHAVALAFSHIDNGRDATKDLSPTLRTGGNAGGMMSVLTQPCKFGDHQQDLIHFDNGIMSTLPAGSNSNSSHYTKTLTKMAVRRLTPIECERLQGFPDGYTNIPWNKKPESPDGPRYKALGNSMAVPVMRWIGERINQYEQQINGI
jgi:site-specific DNA-cytosine methylase